MNNFFASVLTTENGQLPSFDEKIDNGFSDVAVTVCKAGDLLESVNTSKSEDPDEIHPRFLKELTDYLAYPVNILFNNSLAVGRLPSVWKSANVTYIYKSDDKQSASNYKLVLHLSSVAYWRS